MFREITRCNAKFHDIYFFLYDASMLPYIWPPEMNFSAAEGEKKSRQSHWGSRHSLTGWERPDFGCGPDLPWKGV